MCPLLYTNTNIIRMKQEIEVKLAIELLVNFPKKQIFLKIIKSYQDCLYQHTGQLIMIH